MRLVVQQPQFLPWIGFWHKVASADLFVVYAASQFQKHGHENRVTLDGRWLTVPVVKAPLETLVKDMKIADLRALKTIATTIRQRCMGRSARYGDRLQPVIRTLEGWSSPWLLDLTVCLQQDLMAILGLQTGLSVDDVERPGDAISKLDACIQQYAPGCVYLSGAAGADYMGYDSLKVPVATRFQRMRGGVSPDSIVQLIAHHPEPLEAVRQCGVWEDREGKFYDSFGEPAHPGSGAAC